MSGIEILGVVASAVQTADLGARLSVKLFVFSGGSKVQTIPSKLFLKTLP